MTRAITGLIALCAGLLLSGSSLAGDRFALPEDMQKLLPADATAIIAVSSVNELADLYLSVLMVVDEDNTASTSDVTGFMNELLPSFKTVVDLDRPLLVVAGLPNLMGGGEPPFTFILPMRSDFEDFSSLQAGGSYAHFAFEGNYLAASNEPSYAPAPTPPNLAQYVPDGVITMTLDLETVITNYRPIAEMGLASIPTRLDGEPANDQVAFSQAEAQAMGKAANLLMDSITRLDLGLGRDGDLIKWYSGMGFKAGSALDPGPQPAFESALELTRALPAGSDFTTVIAMDQTGVFESFQELYLISMRSALQEMEPDQATRYSAWVEDYLAAADIWANPMAAALRLDEAGVAAHMVMESADADAHFESLTNILTGVHELEIGYSLIRLDDVKIDGVKFRSWDIEFDLDQFETVMPQTPAPSLVGTERLQAEQMTSILRKIMPRIYLGTKGDKLFMASDADTEALAEMVKATGKRGQPMADVARIARNGGPDCQQVITGDWLAIIKWVTDLLEDMDQDDQVVFADNPVPFEGTLTIEELSSGFDVGLDLPAISGLIRAFEEMDRRNSEKAAAEGQSEDENQSEDEEQPANH